MLIYQTQQSSTSPERPPQSWGEFMRKNRQKSAGIVSVLAAIGFANGVKNNVVCRCSLLAAVAYGVIMNLTTNNNPKKNN